MIRTILLAEAGICDCGFWQKVENDGIVELEARYIHKAAILPSHAQIKVFNVASAKPIWTRPQRRMSPRHISTPSLIASLIGHCQITSNTGNHYVYLRKYNCIQWDR